MVDKLKELVRCLDVLQTREDLISMEDPSYFNMNLKDDMLNTALGLANEYLITDRGTPDWSAISVLRKLGYETYAGETDSFGWLTGCIRKRNTSGPVLVLG